MTLMDKINGYNISVDTFNIKDNFSLIELMRKLKELDNFNNETLILEITRQIYSNIDMYKLTDRILEFYHMIDSIDMEHSILLDLKKGNYSDYVSFIEEQAIAYANDMVENLDNANYEEYYNLVSKMEICTNILKDLNVLRRLDISYEMAFAKEVDYNKTNDVVRIEKRADGLYYKYIDIPIPDQPLSEVLDKDTILLNDKFIRSYYDPVREEELSDIQINECLNYIHTYYADMSYDEQKDARRKLDDLYKILDKRRKQKMSLEQTEDYFIMDQIQTLKERFVMETGEDKSLEQIEDIYGSVDEYNRVLFEERNVEMYEEDDLETVEVSMEEYEQLRAKNPGDEVETTKEPKTIKKSNGGKIQ